MTFLSLEECIEVLKSISSSKYNLNVNPDKKTISVFIKDQDINLKIELSPILRQLLDEINYDLKRIDEINYQDLPYLILHIRAGRAALASINNSEIINHKVINKYMVRKKQGKAQYSYLTLKGKARGGAKLRLERTKEFFQEINQKLTDWREEIDLSKSIF
ncbi:MAG: hypothetical protein ACTSPV_18835, partial [Candidatus Hodarchaeales archaeon]